MNQKQRISSGTPFETKVGYSRAIRYGDNVIVSGTTAMKDGKLVGPGDAREQTKQTLANIVWALEQAGATAADVVRYRIYLTNIADWPAVTEEVAAVFGATRPIGTLVEVKGLINPEMLVEIEVDAVLGLNE